MPRRRPLWLPILLVALGCEPPPDAVAPLGPAELVVATGWSRLPVEADPFADHRPADDACPSEHWGPEPFSERMTLEVSTGAERCRWLSAGQPTLSPVRAGDPIQIRVWHFSLNPPLGSGPTTAHVAVALGDAIVWSHRVRIPTNGALLLETVEAPVDAPAGTPMVFHVHNHGDNTWNLLEIIARPAPADDAADEAAE